MTEILDNNINQQFQELIIRTLGIITRNKTKKHIQISLNPLKELFKEYYNKKFSVPTKRNIDAFIKINKFFNYK